jgi:hypothetical protein
MTRPRPSPGAPTGSGASIGVVGLAAVVLGAVLVLVSFTALSWYGGGRGADSAGAAKFGDLHTLATAVAGSGLGRTYFSWLAWILLILVIVIGLAANIPSPGTGALRGIGLVVGGAAAVLTYLAVAKLFDAVHALGGTQVGVFDHAQPGLYLALAGFLLAGVGAAIGPKRA